MAELISKHQIWNQVMHIIHSLLIKFKYILLFSVLLIVCIEHVGASVSDKSFDDIHLEWGNREISESQPKKAFETQSMECFDDAVDSPDGSAASSQAMDSASTWYTCGLSLESFAVYPLAGFELIGIPSGKTADTDAHEDKSYGSGSSDQENSVTLGVKRSKNTRRSHMMGRFLGESKGRTAAFEEESSFDRFPGEGGLDDGFPEGTFVNNNFLTSRGNSNGYYVARRCAEAGTQTNLQLIDVVALDNRYQRAKRECLPAFMRVMNKVFGVFLTGLGISESFCSVAALYFFTLTQSSQSAHERSQNQHYGTVFLTIGVVSGLVKKGIGLYLMFRKQVASFCFTDEQMKDVFENHNDHTTEADIEAAMSAAEIG